MLKHYKILHFDVQKYIFVINNIVTNIIVNSKYGLILVLEVINSSTLYLLWKIQTYLFRIIDIIFILATEHDTLLFRMTTSYR